MSLTFISVHIEDFESLVYSFCFRITSPGNQGAGQGRHGLGASLCLSVCVNLCVNVCCVFTPGGTLFVAVEEKNTVGRTEGCRRG